MFEKTEKISTEWLLHIGGHTIPMVALGNFLKMVFICVSIALSYNLGADWAMQQYHLILEHSSYSVNGFHCVPSTDGNRLVMNCTSNPTKQYETGPGGQTTPIKMNVSYGYGLGN